MAEPTTAVTEIEADLLVVVCGDRRLALTVSSVIEVVGLGRVATVPSGTPPLRGVMEIRSRLLPVYHLGALLAGVQCPEQRGEMAIILAADDRRIGLEVDHADSVRRETVRLMPDEELPGSLGVARQPEGFIPVLDTEALSRLLILGDATDEP